MLRQLSPTERSHLIFSHKKERDGLIRDRIKAVLAYDDGYTYTQIAQILLIDDETIRRHIQDYFSIQKLAPQNGGSKSRLKDDQTAELKSHLESRTYLHVKEICAYVAKAYDISYSISGMTTWLGQHGFCYKKPHGVPAKANAEQQEAFIARYEALKASLKADEVIYFADSSHPQHQTRLAYGWIKKGVRKAEKMTACQKRVNIIGGINLINHQVEAQTVDWVNGESLKGFLNQLVQANPLASTIHIILDNAGYHKSKDLIDYVHKTNIKLHYLPPYSPNLNPVERLWKIMHEQVTYNRYYEKFKDFKEAVVGFFDKIENVKSIIQSRINDNFQKLQMA